MGRPWLVSMTAPFEKTKQNREDSVARANRGREREEMRSGKKTGQTT